ncbi:hypothetical protein [Streptomyces sp. NPDC086766]|uniref:hypothetical protein n=1 Tax=Streptomyces sp. NPDC086766 TaxID=3365754 RepID=UPI0037FA5C22
MDDAARETARLAGPDGAVLAAAALTTHRWEVVHLSRWTRHPAAAGAPRHDGDVFQVLHLSAPGRKFLRRGRHWWVRPAPAPQDGGAAGRARAQDPDAAAQRWTTGSR